MSTINIRHWQATDVDLLVSYFNNLNIWNNMRDYIPHPYTRDDAVGFIATQSEISPMQNFAIVEDSNLVGGIGIILKTDIYRMNAELAYWIAEPSWNKKIATEAVRLMTDYVFQTFRVNRITAEVFEYNKASMRVLEKNGYFLETVSRKGILKNDFLIDNYIWVKQVIY